MAGPRLGSRGAVLRAIVGVLAAASTLTATVVVGVHTVRGEKAVGVALLSAEDDYIMGGTTEPNPGVVPGYIPGVEQLYLDEGTPIAVNTPEEFCQPVCFPAPADDPSSWTNLNFGDSLKVGLAVLNNDISSLAASNGTATVFGYSQSATIATQEMETLHAAGVSDPNLSFVVVGDPNNPIGGILDRFQFPDGIGKFSVSLEPQHLPFINVPLSIPPTPTDAFPVDIYTAEYDGYADFPQDPTNVLGDVSALIGIGTVHPHYPDPGDINFDHPVAIGTIGQATFYEIPQNLPIVQWLYDGGGAGQFFGDVFSPWLRLITDWGYGNAGDPAVDGYYAIPDGSPYEQMVDNVVGEGVPGGPWAETPLGTLWDGSGVAGFFEKMDPLQLLAGVDNAAIQSAVGPIVDVLHDIYGSGPLPAVPADIMSGLTVALQAVTGYDAINLADQVVLTGWNLLTGLPAVAAVIGPDAVLDGPLIPGTPLIDLVGDAFNVFNFFGA
ncbi:PE-PPE domain-containing protein [Mycobacterium sp.]|uniref:PE-PPE domain-containing protein n=1 Tax=Mycobacterium sp. TaxID=1785 RepID=UPI0031DC4674